MLFENDRDALRKRYFDAWYKHVNQKPIEPLETEIIDVILLHPEYQALLEEKHMPNKEYLPESGETNPFLHMGLHLGLREQIKTNRPAGIQPLYQKLTEKLKDPHQAEHQMIDCLAQALWEAQRNRSQPNEQAYLDNLRALI